jgi:nitroreductase
MDLFTAITTRKTTNTKFSNKKISREHILTLIQMASHSPSHFNSQPWRFVIIDDVNLIKDIGIVAGSSMVQLMDDGRFWKQYRKYFRFSEKEIEETKDGIHIDHIPAAIKPFAKQIFSETGGKLISKFKISTILGKDEEELVSSSPVLFVICLTKDEYKEKELSGLYSVISMGAVIQTLWLTTNALGIGMQFVSTPCEIPENWKKISSMIKIPADFEMMAIFRMGYIDKNIPRPTIDWKSSQRKSPGELAFTNFFGNKFF